MLSIPVIDCELSLTLTWFEKCVITTRACREKFVDTTSDKNPQFSEVNSPSKCTFQIKDSKLYVPVVTLSTEDDIKLLEQLKSRFKRTIKWNKYRSDITNLAKNNNLNYLIDPNFNKANRLCALSLEN